MSKPMELYVGLYAWPSLERLPLKDAAGTRLASGLIVMDASLCYK
jgi:hypothetical protein